MTDFAIKPRLTSEQVLAAARSYGWEVVPHSDGGMFAACGAHRMIVAFNEDGTFRAASIRQGLEGLALSLMKQEVLGQLAQHGRPAQ